MLISGGMTSFIPDPLIWLVVRGVPIVLTAMTVMFLPLLWRSLRRRPVHGAGRRRPTPLRYGTWSRCKNGSGETAC